MYTETAARYRITKIERKKEWIRINWEEGE